MNQREQVELKAQERAVIGKQVKQLRRDGWTPGVMYGHGFDPMHLQFETHRLQNVLDDVGGSQLIAIQVQGKGEPEMALVRDVQRDPIRQSVLHVDFYRVKMTERLTTEIPLEMIGESPLTERREGILLIGISSIEVECLPGDLVDAIEVDLSDLVEIDQAIYVHNLAIPSSIDILTDLEEMVVRIAPLEEEEILEELEEEVPMPAIEDVEVITEAAPEGQEEEMLAEEE